MFNAVDVVVLGNSEFTLGFRLAGIKRCVEVENDNNKLAKEVEQALNDKSIGILVLDKNDVCKLPLRVTEKTEYSLAPVVVVLSEDTSSEEDLRRKIRRSIGVDVWETR